MLERDEEGVTMTWTDEAPTVKLANPLADPPARRQPSKLAAIAAETAAHCAAAIARAERIVRK